MNIVSLAKAFGFSECYIFPVDPFVQYERRLMDGALHHDALQLVGNVKTGFDWANALVALISPYRPYADAIPVSGYYPSSNAGYHAANKLLSNMDAAGVRVERAYVPVREMLIRNGIGIPLKNGLTAIPPYGTRFSVQTLIACLSDVAYTPERAVQSSRCENCHACERVCPSHAIDSGGYTCEKCARAYMCGEPMEDWVMDAMTSILGCELCQRVCPYNQGIEPITKLPDAFKLEKLLSGDIKPALQIVGTNLKKNGRLQQHACVVAAKQGRTDLIPLIEHLLGDSREAVRVAARYALNRLKSTEK
jgi:epoxyqueuosine reductase QueG